MAAENSFSYICTRALQSPLFRSFMYCRAASTVVPVLHKATFIPSIQPNLGLPRTRPPLTFAINTLLAIRCSSILSTYPNPSQYSAIHVLEYCSAIWCSAADIHHKLLDRAVSGARFITWGVFECDISYHRSVAVLCMLY